MEKDTIITLEDNTNYVLLDEMNIDGKKYFFAVRLDNETNNPTMEYEIFEEEFEDGNTYMNTLEESDIKESILVEFTKNFVNKLEETN